MDQNDTNQNPPQNGMQQSVVNPPKQPQQNTSAVTAPQPVAPVTPSQDEAIQDLKTVPQVSDPELKAYLEKVEKALLDEIVLKLKEKQVTVEESQKTAQDFLSLLPPKDKNDLLEKLYKLSKKHPKEVLGVYLTFATPEYEVKRKQQLQTLAELIHAGNIDEALRIAKEENNNG